MESVAGWLKEGAAELGIALAPEQLESLSSYLYLLEKWNQRINLTGTRERRELALHHVVDSLAVLAFLPDRAARLIDVGSGAGLPGAVIACMRPDVRVTALEPIHKKHAFLSAVRRELAWSNLEPRCERLEAHLARPDFEPYDAAVSRATFELLEWLRRGRELVHDGGVVIGMEGRTQHELPANAARHSYRLDGRTRSIVTMQCFT